MKRRPRGYWWRRRGLLAGLVLAALVVLGRGFQLQVLEGARWAARAEEQQRHHLVLPAPRGTIYDRNGIPLASTREVYRVALAPRELRDRAAAASRLREALGLSAAAAQKAVDRSRRWVVLPGRYAARVREQLNQVRGIYFERVFERFHPRGDLALELLGRVAADGRPVGGLELEYDSVLTGAPGLAVVRRDARGEPIPGAMLVVREPVAGSDLYLTIDVALQEIAHEALEHAMERTGAAGGDVVIADPRSGELLAAASRREHGSTHWRAATEPYEPGSTLKPFLVAALLAEGRASLEDSVYAEQGHYVEGGRTILDAHPYGWLTVREALRFSSNIAMAKLSGRVEPAKQYEYLRGFGFGTRTGVAYPSESSGLLRRPEQWSGYSQASLAIGYEIAVTPLQMAMAYGALANGGVLMEPRLVRELKGRDGRIVARFSPEPVRRVIPEAVAEKVASALVDVVEEGTGRRAALGAFQVAGKTGTAQRFDGVDYVGGGYTASFAGFFPAADPQMVFLVKLDRPKDPYYGGLAAAPVTRATLESALAARNTPLDRRAVVAASTLGGGQPVGRGARLPQDWSGRRQRGGAPLAAAAASTPGPFIFALDAGPPRRYRPTATPANRTVPEVRGLSLRDAIARLHARGFRVRLEGVGPVRATAPAAGIRAAPGTTVRVRGREAMPVPGTLASCVATVAGMASPCGAVAHVTPAAGGG